jgi:hypothetical protein
VRDWPSFLYIALAGLVFLYLPYQVYQLYRRAQVQATVIDSIASGDPDIRQVLGLLSADPTAHWVSDKVVEKAEPAKVDYSSRNSPPELMQARFTIDHPYGSLIGWSVVNPQLDSVYECRWTKD